MQNAQDEAMLSVSSRVDVPELVLGTANGALPVKEAVEIQIGPLGEVSQAYVLQDTPNVLTLGRRCGEFRMPESRGGGKNHVETVSDVPYIVEYEFVPRDCTPAAPATASPDRLSRPCTGGSLILDRGE